MCKALRRSKRQRKQTSFGDNFYTFLIGNDPLSFLEATSAPYAKDWIRPLGLKLIQIRKIILGL